MLGVWWSKIMPPRPSHVRVRDVLTTIEVLRAVCCGQVKSNCTVGRCEITRYDRQSPGSPVESRSQRMITRPRHADADRSHLRPSARAARRGAPAPDRRTADGTAHSLDRATRGPGPLWSDHGVACFRARHRRRTGARPRAPRTATGMESTTHKALLDVLHSFRYLRHPPPAPRGPSLGSRLYRSPGRSTCSPQRLFRSRPSLIPHTSL